jgi:multidrug resistance efflux pump
MAEIEGRLKEALEQQQQQQATSGAHIAELEAQLAQLRAAAETRVEELASAGWGRKAEVEEVRAQAAAAAAYAPTFFAHEKDPFQGPKVQPAAVDTTAAEEAPQKKLKHNATVSSGAYMSCKLSVVADPNSKVYERLTAEEIDTSTQAAPS